jgi:enoyl-CoA hydratase
MSVLVLREDVGAITTLTLNRPEKRNALNLELWAELEKHINDIQIAAQDIAVVILRANGPVFSAGSDLSDRGKPVPRNNYQASIITRLAALPQPVIASVHAACFTGGLELVLASDIIVAGESASFADTHGKFSLVPLWGMSQRLPRRVGQWHAREMSFTGLPVSAKRAEQIGLINRCVPDDDLASETARIAEAIAAQSRHSVFGYKQLYNQQMDLSYKDGLAHEIFYTPGPGADIAERVAKQLKR